MLGGGQKFGLSSVRHVGNAPARVFLLVSDLQREQGSRVSSPLAVCGLILSGERQETGRPLRSEMEKRRRGEGCDAGAPPGPRS